MTLLKQNIGVNDMNDSTKGTYASTYFVTNLVKCRKFTVTKFSRRAMLKIYLFTSIILLGVII